ncbi:hypothetical protein JHK85_000902 [Glycine max]|nr:hypothetical protein JHK85_000902 [Glycine max]
MRRIFSRDLILAGFFYGDLYCLSHRQASSISEFTFLQKFIVSAKPPKPIQIKQVTWSPPACGFNKCNTDDAARGSPGM